MHNSDKHPNHCDKPSREQRADRKPQHRLESGPTDRKIKGPTWYRSEHTKKD